MNAIKYTPQGGKVTLSASVEGKMAMIHVCDTGIGIPRPKLRVSSRPSSGLLMR